AWDQVALRDVQLLELRVTAELDDLHAVLQRNRDRVQAVRGGHEHHVTQIVVEIEVVIVEAVVLLRVEHLEQRGGRIPAEIRAHLVDLVEQEDGIVRAHALQVLDDLAGQRADVRAPVAPDLRLITHAAERDAYKLPARRTRDAARD